MAAVITKSLLEDIIQEVESNGNHKVCVVGIIGNCAFQDKGLLTNQLIGKDVFHVDSTLKKNGLIKDNGEGDQVSIKLYYDEVQRTIYVQVSSINDTASLVKSLLKLQSSPGLSPWYKFWQDIELKHASALLLLFSVCHIVMVTFPTPRFDLGYIRLFKLLASVRHNMLHNLSSALSTVDDISEIWRTTGRPCIPRIIFAFQIPFTSRGRSVKDVTSCKNIQQSLQEQVHLILKKNRLLGSLSSSSLFTVSSPNQTFVHVQQLQRYSQDPLRSCLCHVWKHSINQDGLISVSDDRTSPSHITTHISQTSMIPVNGYSAGKTRYEQSLQEFLYRQIDYMMTVESRDIPAEGRRGTHVEAPTASLWLRVCKVLLDFFLPDQAENTVHIDTLSSSLDLDWKFSENRCRKVLPLATNSYLDNLPSHYTQSTHIAQLRQALNVFTMNARGPAFEDFANQLQEDCNQIWWSGRQLCEVRSLTGQPCVYPFHQIPQPHDHAESKQIGVPCKPHSSRVTSQAACNCGRTRGIREDPFDLKTANYDFYCDLEKQCCSYLTHMEFPVIGEKDDIPKIMGFPCTVDVAVSGDTYYCGANSYANPAIKEDMTDRQKAIYTHPFYPSSIKFSHASLKDVKDGGSATDPSEQGLSFGCLFPEGLSDYGTESATMFDATISETTAEAAFTQEGYICGKSSLPRTSADFGQHKRIPSLSYLETMLTTDTEAGILPQYPSWSLLVLGAASVYNPGKGLEQPGFLSGSNYLLPWDLPLNDGALAISADQPGCDAVPNDMEEASQWPPPGENKQLSGPLMHLHFFQTASKVTAIDNDLNQTDTTNRYSNTKSQRKNVQKTTTTASVLKTYIGNEYECPFGHRLLYSSSDQMVKVSGHARESALRLVNQDMPLYCSCPCGTHHIAQLMRTYIVTPENTVTIRINPLVQVGDGKKNAEIFCTGIKNGILLPANSFCVLRFPYVYFGYGGPVLPRLQSCKLLKGMFSYVT